MDSLIIENFPPFREATCPRPDCQEHLKADQSGEVDESKVKTCLSGLSALIIIFPSDYDYQIRFARKEIADLLTSMNCSHRQQGCPWEGRLEELEKHLNECPFAPAICPHCRLIMPHKMGCPVKCPFANFRCSCTQQVRVIIILE